MSHSLPDAVTALALVRLVLPVLLVRLTPVVLHVLLARESSARARLVALLGHGALLGLCHAGGLPATDLLALAAGAYAYLAAVALAVVGLARGARRGRWPQWLVLGICGAGLLVIPGLLLPDWLRATASLLGWEMFFAATSYAIEHRRARREPTCAEALFFLLVNPTLVYTERGERIAGLSLGIQGWARVLAGVLALWACHVLRALAMLQADQVSVFTPSLFALLLTVAEYLGHSGRASVEIGLMRFLGWQVPERFQHPFLARSPADFWRRWNRYVGGWAAKYVYRPMARRLARRLPWLPRFASVGLSVIAAFAVIGALHDVATVVRMPPAFLLGGMTMVFALNGLVVVLWEAGRRLARACRPRTRAWAGVASWLACMWFLQIMGVIAIFVFSGHYQALRRLLPWLAGS